MKTGLKDIKISKVKTLKLLNQIDDLPVDNAALSDVLQLLKEPNVSFSKLSKRIQRDHGLITKVLKFANSPETGLQHKVYSIERALILLGLTNINKLMNSALNGHSFSANVNYEWYRNSFWRHSVFVANTAKSIAEDLNFNNPELVFTAGLLHDIGILIIQNYLPEEYLEINEIVEEDKLSHLKAEELILGINHSDIAKFLFEKWFFPHNICEAAANHHIPLNAEEAKIEAAIIHLADYIVSQYSVKDDEWDRNLILDESIISILKFSNDDFDDRAPFIYKDILEDIVQRQK